jgi:hypothetical protein
MVKTILKYTALIYIILIASMVADSNITGWHLSHDHNMGNVIFFTLAFFWWIVPILVVNLYVIVDWSRKNL